MSSADRRSWLGWGVAALAFAAVPARGAAPALRFDPPPTPMLYARRLERGLPGGAILAVDRRFAIRFVHQPGGFRVEGEQVAVEVDAPGPLAEFARIERERREAGLFPLALDTSGTIRGLAAGIDTGRLEEAVGEAVARIERSGYPPAERERLRAFVDAVHRSAGAILTELPHDLFAPVDCPRTERRAVALPTGDRGEVRLSFDATRDPASGLMRSARREVVTEIAGDSRRTVESWTLTPLA